MATDSELVLHLQAGNLNALGELYDRHRQLVYRTALAISGDCDAASDLLQDVFLRLYRFAAHVDPQRPLEPWLYRMTANLSLSWVKRHRWLQPLEDVVEWLAGDKKQSPHNQVEADEVSQQVRQAILALPLPQRVVVVMYYVNDLSLQDISQIVNVPEGTVKSRLHYGRQTLRAHLGPQVFSRAELLYEFT